MDFVSQFIKDIGVNKILIGIGIFLFIAFCILIFATILDKKDFGILYSNLSLEDSAKIVKELEMRGDSYELVGDGSIIRVPIQDLLRIRVHMAELGLPQQGNVVGYELFDKGESITTSNFLQNINFLRALEGELSRTIMSFENVEKARVHLVIPKRETFAKDKTLPRASIQIKFKTTQQPSKLQINAITHLVVTAVPELVAEEVTIVDTFGKPLRLGGKSQDDFDSSGSQEYRISYENRLKNIIEDLLEQSIGIGKVKAYVNVDMNFDRIITNQEIFDPESKVARTTQTTEERENNSNNETSGDISVTSNMPENDVSGFGRNISQTEKSDEIINFEISKTVKNHISESGTIKKLSVAVMVDGNYTFDANKKSNIYVARTQSEIDEYKRLVKSAIGFKDDRDTIEVLSFQMSNPDEKVVEQKSIIDFLKDNIQTIVVGLLSIIIAFSFKNVLLKTFESYRSDLNQHEAGLQSIDTAINFSEYDVSGSKIVFDESSINQDRTMINNLVEISRRHPQQTASIISKWINL